MRSRSSWLSFLAIATVAPVAGISRRKLSTLAATSGCLALSPRAYAAVSVRAPPRIGTRGFLDLRIIESYTLSEVLEDAALRGRLTVGLYDDLAPRQAARFVELLTGRRGGRTGEPDSFPQLSSALIDHLRPGELLLSGSCSGVREVVLPDSLGGGVQYEWSDRIVPLRPIYESVRLSHDRRGLLTHRIEEGGTKFAITLGPAPQLDRDWAVFGEVLDGSGPNGLLAECEALPFLSGQAAATSQAGQLGAKVYAAQRAAFSAISRSLGDRRADELKGQLLRRVEIVSSGLL